MRDDVAGGSHLHRGLRRGDDARLSHRHLARHQAALERGEEKPRAEDARGEDDRHDDRDAPFGPRVRISVLPAVNLQRGKVV